MDLTTTLPGAELRNPLVASASPLSQTSTACGGSRTPASGPSSCTRSSRSRCAGRRRRTRRSSTQGTESFGESLSLLPGGRRQEPGPRRYLSLLERAAAAVDIPVIAQPQRRHARRLDRLRAAIQEAGADALELNIYSCPATRRSGREVEQRPRRPGAGQGRGRACRSPSSSSPFFSSTATWRGGSMRRARTGSCSSTGSSSPTSTSRRSRSCPVSASPSPSRCRLPLTWIAILHGRVGAVARGHDRRRGGRPTSSSSCSPARTS